MGIAGLLTRCLSLLQNADICVQAGFFAGTPSHSFWCCQETFRDLNMLFRFCTTQCVVQSHELFSAPYSETSKPFDPYPFRATRRLPLAWLSSS